MCNTYPWLCIWYICPLCGEKGADWVEPLSMKSSKGLFSWPFEKISLVVVKYLRWFDRHNDNLVYIGSYLYPVLQHGTAVTHLLRGSPKILHHKLEMDRIENPKLKTSHIPRYPASLHYRVYHYISGFFSIRLVKLFQLGPTQPTSLSCLCHVKCPSG